MATRGTELNIIKDENGLVRGFSLTGPINSEAARYCVVFYNNITKADIHCDVREGTISFFNPGFMAFKICSHGDEPHEVIGAIEKMLDGTRALKIGPSGDLGNPGFRIELEAWEKSIPIE